MFSRMQDSVDLRRNSLPTVLHKHLTLSHNGLRTRSVCSMSAPDIFELTEGKKRCHSDSAKAEDKKYFSDFQYTITEQSHPFRLLQDACTDPGIEDVEWERINDDDDDDDDKDEEGDSGPEAPDTELLDLQEFMKNATEGSKDKKDDYWEVKSVVLNNAVANPSEEALEDDAMTMNDLTDNNHRPELLASNETRTSSLGMEPLPSIQPDLHADLMVLRRQLSRRDSFVEAREKLQSIIAGGESSLDNTPRTPKAEEDTTPLLDETPAPLSPKHGILKRCPTDPVVVPRELLMPPEQAPPRRHTEHRATPNPSMLGPETPDVDFAGAEKKKRKTPRKKRKSHKHSRSQREKKREVHDKDKEREKERPKSSRGREKEREKGREKGSAIVVDKDREKKKTLKNTDPSWVEFEGEKQMMRVEGMLRADDVRRRKEREKEKESEGEPDMSASSELDSGGEEPADSGVTITRSQRSGSSVQRSLAKVKQLLGETPPEYLMETRPPPSGPPASANAGFGEDEELNGDLTRFKTSPDSNWLDAWLTHRHVLMNWKKEKEKEKKDDKKDTEEIDRRVYWIRKGSKKKSERTGSGATVIISHPANVIHKIHVDFDFNWSGDDPAHMFILTRKLGQG